MYKKHKLFFTTFIIATLFLLVNMFTTFINNYTPKIKKYATYEVSYGDSIWQIAQKYQRENIDIRFIVDEIYKKNKLHSDVIVSGQVLEIPIYEE